MSKFIALAAVVAAVLLPAAANAATVTKLSGVVRSKESARHSLVVASPRGKVTTVRATAHQVRATPLGSRISAAGTLLADGSLHATRITRSGTTKHAHIVVTVLKANGKKLLSLAEAALSPSGSTRRPASTPRHAAAPRPARSSTPTWSSRTADSSATRFTLSARRAWSTSRGR